MNQQERHEADDPHCTCNDCMVTFEERQLLAERAAAHGLVAAAKAAQLPALYSTDGQGDDAIARLKFFTPWSNWTWYVLEFDGDDECFGLVQGHEEELGSFSLAEMEAVRGQWGLRIERDLHFEPQPLSKVRKK